MAEWKVKIREVRNEVIAVEYFDYIKDDSN